jgi:hypothetical protein
MLLTFFGAFYCIFGTVLLSFRHRGRPVDLFYYEGGGGFGATLLGIICIFLGLGVLAGGARVWVNRETYQHWQARRNAEPKEDE